jgi:hypothetical protein
VSYFARSLASASGSGFPPFAIRSRNSSKYFSCPGGGNQEHAARRRTGITERVRDAGRDEHKGPRPAAHNPFAATQINLALENVEQLLDLSMVVRARVESRRNRELEHRALFGVFGRK